MNSAVFHIFSLFSAEVFPVKSCMSAQSSGRIFSKDSRCCSIKGLVGAKIRIFSKGNFLNLSTDVIIAMRVFPVPVGRTTRQLCSLHVLKIFCWYSLGLIFSSSIDFGRGLSL